MDSIVDEKALSFAVELAIKRHEEELKRTENLNNRANSLIGYAATLGALFFGIILPKLSNNAFLFGITFFVFFFEFFVIILCLVAGNALLVKWFITGPGGRILSVFGKTLSETEIKERLLESYVKAYDNNYQRNIKSANLISWASILFSIGFILGLIGFFAQFIISSK